MRGGRDKRHRLAEDSRSRGGLRRPEVLGRGYANFSELRTRELRRTPLPRTRVYEDMKKGARLLAAPTPSRMLLG